MSDLVPVFADQLSLNLSSLQNTDKGKAVILMMEVAQEADTVWHHRKKLVFLFSAMRHFAKRLEREGWNVRYVSLDDKENSGSFSGEMKRAVKELKPDRIFVTEPGEYRVEEMIRDWRESFDIPVKMLRDRRFLASRQEFAEWTEGRKQLRMEYFYREMRKATGLLMEGDKPVGGKWNYDKENRKPASRNLDFPGPAKFEPDEITREVIDMVQEKYPDRFGKIDPFWFAVTAEDAKKAASHFIANALEKFGDYQDAMLEEEPFLFHSVLSQYINAGLLDPLKVCKMAEKAFRDEKVPINSAEGFIRQIIGWREYVRGIYWLEMPDYEKNNFLNAKNDLPEFYWTGDTKMNCVANAIGQTRKHAHAHHILRLMVTGNFALIAGINPHQLHEWYLAVYADAFEWVEMPNTMGMTQFADGGLLASKPYAASGAYINRMSDFCGNCHYEVNEKTGKSSCPFNSLYWNFMDRNRERLKGNSRMAMMYKNLDRMDEETLEAINETATGHLESMKSGRL